MCDFFPPGIMSAHGLLSSVFSCSQGSKSTFKRRLRQTRSLDPAMMMRPRGSEVDEPTQKGDFNWKRVHGRSVGLQPVPLQSLSELERVRLQEVAFCRLLEDHDLGCQISMPKDGQKRKKSLRRKLDSLSKERSKDKDHLPQAFGVPLAEVIANDRAFKQRLDAGPQGAPEGRGDRGEEGEESEEEDQSCATVLTLRQEESQEDSPEEEEQEEPVKEVLSGELALLLAQSDVLQTGDARLRADGLGLLQAHRTQYGDSRDFLWRLARAYSAVHASTHDPEQRSTIAQQGRDEAESVLRKNDLDADCHIRFAVLAGLTSQTDSMHSKLKSQRILKEHLDRALALRDDLPLAFYLLGSWSYQVATLGWLERKAAAALYDQPPRASLHDALGHFMKAEQLSPGYSKLLRLHIAKCHKELGNASEAGRWTRLALEAPTTPDEDEETAALQAELSAATDQ